MKASKMNLWRKYNPVELKIKFANILLSLFGHINTGESVISKEVMQNKKINESKSADEIKFFDPAIHRIDPNINVKGQNSGIQISGKGSISKHVWEETLTTMDIDIPILISAQTVVQKEDLDVTIRYLYRNFFGVAFKKNIFHSATAIKVRVFDQTIFEGPFQGKVIPSMCMWALLPASESLAEDGFRAAQRLQISLEKGCNQ